MDFAFPWPASDGEWLAWSSAAVTAIFGLLLFFMPRLSLRLLRLQPMEGRPDAVGEARATLASFYLGVGLCCLLLGPQPFVYMALGFCWLFAAFGRIVSMLSDRGNKAFNWISLVVDLALAALPLSWVFGFVE